MCYSWPNRIFVSQQQSLVVLRRNVGSCLQTVDWSISVCDSDTAKISRVNCEWCEVKFVNEDLRKYGVCVCVCVREVRLLFLTLPSQGTTPQILKLKFPVHTSGPKQKHK